MTISKDNYRYSVECLKFAKFLTGERLYLFKNQFPITDYAYIVAVRKDSDTFYFNYFVKLEKAIAAYLEQLLIYA